MNTKKFKTYKNFLFIPCEGYSGIQADLSDGYLKEGLDGNRIVKLPHNNYVVLGIVDECINALYAEEFSERIVEKDALGNYLDYELGEHHYNTAIDSFHSLVGRFDLVPTDYILEDTSYVPGKDRQNFEIVLAEKYAEGKPSLDVFKESHIKDFLEGFGAAKKDFKKQIKDLYNHYNSKLKESTVTKLGRREKTEYTLRLEGKVDLLKIMLDKLK